jgi:multiple sugar transport system substrate-binding protein
MKRNLVLAGLATVALGTGAVAQKKVISISSWAGNDKLIEAVLPGFYKLYPNVEVKVVGGLGYSDYHPALNNRLQAGNAEDVVSLGGQFVVGYADSTLMEDLTKAPYNFNAVRQRGFVQSQIANATGPDGKVVAVPNDAPPNVMYYRKDVLAKAGVSINDITRSWDGYIEAGKKLKAQGIFISGSATDVANTIIAARIPSGEGVYFDAAGKPVVDNARFVRAFTIAKQVRGLGLDSRIAGWSPEWFAAFKDGKVATITVGSWFENIITDQISKGTTDQWAVALAPERSTSVNGGAYYAIPAASKNKTEAWALIDYLTSDAVLAEVFKQSGNFPARLSTLANPVFREPSAFFGGQQVRQIYAQAARAMTPVPSSKNYALAEQIVQDALTQVLEQNKDIKTALAEAKALIERRTSR